MLILRGVLGFSAREVVNALGATTAAVNSALQRARNALDERLPARSQQATMPEGPQLRYVATRANGQPALGTYALDPAGAYLPIALDVLTLRGGLVADVTAFRTTGAFARFGLPEALPGP